MITLFGTTDNYNTEQSERLHIDLTKDAYRATNHKDEYAQMTVWLERKEKVSQHADFIRQQEQAMANEGRTARQMGPLGPPHPSTYIVRMTQHPTFKAISFEVIETQYGATYFRNALGDYIARVNNPTYAGRRLHARSANTLIPFNSVPVFNKIKFTLDKSTETVDSVHVRPEQVDTRGRTVPARFDTILVRGGTQWSRHSHQRKFD